MAHPDLFRSGYMYCPCTFDAKSQEMVMKLAKRNHLLLSLECRPGIVEGFCFNGPNFGKEELTEYLSDIDLLKKFSHYFRKEASHLIESIRKEGYNIKKIRGADFQEVPDDIPLLNKKSKHSNFLKDLWGLSPQEQRCLELFKQGHTAQASAAKMGLSQRTVEHYLDNIKLKLNCISKWDLLNY